MARKRLVTRTPSSWLGTIAEAVFGTAGRSVIIDGAWYRFTKGRGVVKSDASIAATRADLCIVDAGPTDEDLTCLVGTRWSILNNCATVFAPFWRPDMSQVTPGDRSSIARSVVLSIVVVLALGGGAVYLIDQWAASRDARIIAEIERLDRSQAARFGKLMSEIERTRHPQAQ